MKSHSQSLRAFCALVLAAMAIVSASAQQSFQVTSFSNSNARLVHHQPATGDDRGGIALSSSSIFYTGDSTTARFDRSDLLNASAVSPARVIDGLVSNLRSKQVYTLASDFGAITMTGGFVTHLIEIDPVTGAQTAQVLNLSSGIPFFSGEYPRGIFAGWDRIVLVDGNQVGYNIDLPSGTVTLLGYINLPAEYETFGRMSCENSTSWGVAEFTAGNIQLLYTSWNYSGFPGLMGDGGGSTIMRYDISTGMSSQVPGAPTDLSDLCSFTVDPSLNRWYFHYEGYSSAFDFGMDENIGYADATFLSPSAASIAISGRVTQGKERPISGAIVKATSSSGKTVSVMTNASGNYTLQKLAPGESYMLSVSAKRFTFDNSTSFVTPHGNLDGVDFQAN